MRTGKQTSLYIMKEIEEKLDAAIQKVDENGHKIYKSRNHFINCTIIKELRKQELWPKTETVWTDGKTKTEWRM